MLEEQSKNSSLACGSWSTNSSCVLPTSCVVYQPVNHGKTFRYFRLSLLHIKWRPPMMCALTRVSYCMSRNSLNQFTLLDTFASGWRRAAEYYLFIQESWVPGGRCTQGKLRCRVGYVTVQVLLSVQEILCSTPDQTSSRVKGEVLFGLCLGVGRWGCQGRNPCIYSTSRGCHNFRKSHTFALAKGLTLKMSASRSSKGPSFLWTVLIKFLGF